MRNVGKVLLFGMLTGLLGASMALAQGSPAARPVAGIAARSGAEAGPKADGPAKSDEAGRLSSDDANARNYVLGPADVVEVSVLGHPEFVARERIDESGTIRLAFLGSTAAANKTTLQLGEEIAKSLETGGYYTHPIVKVEIASYASRYVTVLGNVGTSGLVPVDRAYRLSEIIARVGGVKETGANYVVLRQKAGGERRISIEALATGDLKDDPYVSPGDKIYSPPAELFYVSGQVKLPGTFPMVPDLTFRMAIARGGGLTDSGSDKGVTVTRAGQKMRHIDLDAKVMPGDVIIVGERLF